MVLHDSHHHEETEPEAASARNARLGMKLFLVYLAVYVGFMLLTAFAPEKLRTMLPGGVNLAIGYGMLLIIGAFVMALVYGWLCRTVKNP